MINFNENEAMGVVWEALHNYRDHCDNEQWDEICTAMAWISEALERGQFNIEMLDEICKQAKLDIIRL